MTCLCRINRFSKLLTQHYEVWKQCIQTGEPLNLSNDKNIAIPARGELANHDK